YRRPSASGPRARRHARGTCWCPTRSPRRTPARAAARWLSRVAAEARGTRTSAFSSLSDEYRIGHTCLREPCCTKRATVAVAARPSLCVRVVAAVRQAVIEAESKPFLDDLGLGQHLQRCVDPECISLHTFCGRERRETFKRGDVFGPAVRVAGV